MKVMAFTGPRPAKLCGWNHKSYEKLIRDLSMKLKSYYKKEEVRKFITGGAQGFDQCAFLAVQEMRERYNYTDIQNIVYVPFNGQKRLWSEDGCFGKEEYRDMLNAADEVNLLMSTTPIGTKEYSKALFNRNTEMVNAADIVFALYDKDDWNTAFGGTQDAMRKAKRMQKELHQARFIIENEKVKLTTIETI